MLKKRWYRIILLAVTVMLYIVANVADYHYTVYGIENGIAEEGNSVAQNFIDIFGLAKGLSFYKILLVTLILIGAILSDLEYCQKNKYLFPNNIACLLLCLGTATTLIAVKMWIKMISP